MRRFLPVLGMIGLLTLTLANRAYPAQPVKALNPQQVITATLTATPGTLGQATPTAQPPMQSTPTSMPQPQPTLMNALPYGPKMGMGKGTMGNGKMGSMMDMKGGKQRRIGMTAGQGSNSGAGPAMMNVPMMNDSVAMLLGMNLPDQYSQLASGKSLAQIAAEKGVTQQQLKDTIMAGGSVWNDPIMTVIYGHYLTGYELTGKHIQVPCNQCHLNNDYTNTPTACNDCHAKDDVHKGQLGTDCAACHTTATWER